MKHFIRHPQKGWLGYDRDSSQISWTEHHWYATHFEIDELSLVLMALGRDRDEVAIIPWNKETPAWYDRAEPISFNLSPNQHDWLEEHVRTCWGGIGNCYWFVDDGDKSYGPINPHPLGGFMLPFNQDGDRYESVFMAAAVMMQDKVELFKKVAKA